MRPIVFLHIPKTAGQTVHHALGALVGLRNISPVRVNEQAENFVTLPPGYLMHSGHLDWTGLEQLEGNPFVFTVLRDPGERIGSFYFYMLETARNASPEELRVRHGLQHLLDSSVDEYFFGGDAPWQGFINNIYNNFYCSYFATRKVGGRKLLLDLDLDRETIVSRALEGSRAIERIYRTENLTALEEDIARLYGQRIKIAAKFANVGTLELSEPRWPKLIARMESDASIRRLEGFLEEDKLLMERLSEAGRLI